MSKEAMKLALEALEQARGALAYVAVGNAETNPNLARSTCSHGIYAIDKVEPALREALAEQPAQQEPVALNRTGIQKLLEQSGYCNANPQEQAAFISGIRHRESEMLDTSPPAQPAQQLPFGVGGGLVAIKTLLSRDPCAHAKVAIEMIDAMLSEQPAQQEPVACAQIVSLNDTQGVVEWLPHNGATLKAGDYLYTPTPAPAQRKPLTRDQVKAMMVENGYDNASPQERADFINGLRHGEVAHGITKGGAA